jgi:hypothetical protein
MATTTPNYGWTVPTSTDLVKDGATAIETLGDAIDASMNTALGTKKAGMVLLNTTSFSGVTSISLPASTFSATYDNYKIIIDLESVSGTTPTMSARFRVGGVNTTASAYKAGGRLTYQNGSPTSFNDQDAAFIALGQTQTGQGNFVAYTMELIAPFATKKTQYFVGGANNDPTQVYGFYKSGSYDATTSFDSLSLIASTGNIEGIITAYGYNK